MNGKWHISTSNESGFYGDCDSKEEAIELAKAKGYDVVYVGQGRAPDPLSEGVFADQVIENAMDTLEEDWCLEFALFEPTKEQVEDLQQRLRAVVDQWTETYSLQPNWFLVDDVERIEIDEDGDLIKS